MVHNNLTFTRCFMLLKTFFRDFLLEMLLSERIDPFICIFSLFSIKIYKMTYVVVLQRVTECV